MEQNHASAKPLAGSPADAFDAGTIIGGRYRLASAVVRQSTDTIYTALDERSRSRVRIRITPQEPSEALSEVTHPTIPVPLASGRIGHWHYVVTEWFDGAPLQEGMFAATDGVLPIERQRAWATLAMDMLDVLEHLNRCSGRGHGNLSLSSFWEGRDGRLRIIDSSAPDGPLGPEGVPYASPERLRGMPRDARSDVYQLACVLYALLFGIPPYGLDLVEARSGHLLSRLPDRPPSDTPLDPSLFAVLRTALEKQPHHRFAGPAEMRAAFGIALSALDQASRDPDAEFSQSTETVIRTPGDLHFPIDTLASAPARDVFPTKHATSRQTRTGRSWLVALAALVVFGLSAAAVVWVAILGSVALIAAQSQSTPSQSTPSQSAPLPEQGATAQTLRHTENGGANRGSDLASSLPTAHTEHAAQNTIHAPQPAPQAGIVPIDFAPNDWRRPTTRATFPQFLELVRQHPGLVKLTGHTDDRGPAEINYQIGLGRAWAAQKLLVFSGIAEPKLPIDSKGESAPVADNSTPEGRAANRRVTAEFLAPGTPAADLQPTETER